MSGRRRTDRSRSNIDAPRGLARSRRGGGPLALLSHFSRAARLGAVTCERRRRGASEIVTDPSSSRPLARTERGTGNLGPVRYRQHRQPGRTPVRAPAGRNIPVIYGATKSYDPIAPSRRRLVRYLCRGSLAGAPPYSQTRVRRVRNHIARNGISREIQRRRRRCLHARA